ncbi:Tim44 domain-containing protein [Halomonas sp. TD01]|uniref:Tim44 domain-containing protein n=1 Tax=Halomonas sp. TD01 TaxID=999141 RepID=UPI000214F25E|nr:Tim44-like domain-containing protein [Halomonas sp. TD01]EGP18940.1 import inner membrane translocase, subunit Tim44 [Halomonas sp. TD01]CAH1042289.1 import inner membrane translocase, subunit Tim44 [Halomonas sp. TD01]
MLRQFFVMLLVSVMGISAAVEYAEARRLGGGSSMGSVSRSADRPASTPAQQQAQGTQQQGQAAATRRGGIGGMVGGLLAGGLLAALFFGGAFDELRLMDLLLMAGIVALAIFAFRTIIRQRRPASATTGGYQREQQEAPAPAGFSATPGSLANGLQSTPAWFDKERFLGGAKEHFMTLQRAWDNNDLNQIQEYVTPELYNLLRKERAEQPANNRTDVIRLFAELGDINEYDDYAEATVIFHGLLEENGAQTEFNETWHLTRTLRDQAPWYLQGIEQNPGA